MKKLHLSWSAVAILAPVVVVCAIVMGSIHGTAPALAAKKKASLQVAFITNVTGLSGAPVNHIQNLFLNVSSVRINPKPKPGNKNQSTPAEGAGNWVTIPIPSGVGNVSHGNPGDLQIDMIAGQSQAQYYNTGSVTQKTYYTVELEFDTSNPGFVVPNCPSAGPREGCINYPVIFANPGGQVVFSPPQGLPVTKGALNLLLIQINVSIVATPSGPGQPYTVDVSIEQGAPGNYLGVVSGTVASAGGAINKKKVSKLMVTAEASGSGTTIASAPVDKSGNYNFYLPAVPNGTFYDLYAAGGGGSYEAVRTATALTPSATLTVPFGTVSTGHSLGSITGVISDQCTGKPISGATLQLLIPPDSDPSANCADPAMVSQCVTVASTTTDNVGGFPQPGTVLAPAAFNQIPIISGTTYTLEVSASGYDTLLVPGVTATSGSSKAGGDCGTASSTSAGCNLSLTTGYVNGTVNLGVTPQNGEIILLQVFAETTDTSNLVAALPSPLLIRGPNQTVNFKLNVPTAVSMPGKTLDMFAQALDLYQGASDPYPGHSIIVASGVQLPTAACASSSDAPFSEAMVCSGHGSVAGSTANPDTGTTVALLKNGVILTTSPGGVPYPAPSPSNTYGFCAPPDNYSVQRFAQQGNPPTPVPVGTPAAVGAMATPQATSTPCPSTCFSGMTDGSGNQLCPGICGATFGPSL